MMIPKWTTMLALLAMLPLAAAIGPTHETVPAGEHYVVVHATGVECQDGLCRLENPPVYVEIWQETNGVPGLQTEEDRLVRRVDFV